MQPEVLNEFLNSIADKKGMIKTQSLIVLLKGFGLYKGNNDAERVLKSLCPKNDGLIPKNVLQNFFQSEIKYERGKLTEEDYSKAFDAMSRDGLLSFEILMKNGDELGHHLSEKDSKKLIRLFALGNTELTKEDFIRIFTRSRRQTSAPKESKILSKRF